jgi:hypothetical protein
VYYVLYSLYIREFECTGAKQIKEDLVEMGTGICHLEACLEEQGSRP